MFFCCSEVHFIDKYLSVDESADFTFRGLCKKECINQRDKSHGLVRRTDNQSQRSNMLMLSLLAKDKENVSVLRYKATAVSCIKKDADNCAVRKFEAPKSRAIRNSVEITGYTSAEVRLFCHSLPLVSLHRVLE